MKMTENSLAVFENHKIRRHYDEETEAYGIGGEDEKERPGKK